MLGRNVRRALIMLMCCGLLPACEAYEPPPLPSTPSSPGASTIPTRMSLTASSRADGGINIAAMVLAEAGNGVPNVPVAFTIGAGTLDPPTVSTDQTGTARTIAVSEAMTTISATIAGGIVAYVDVLRSPQP
jgi:hypothetical protein